MLEPDMLEWLIDEMAQNRQKNAVKQKVFLLQTLRDTIRQGCCSAIEAFCTQQECIEVFTPLVIIEISQSISYLGQEWHAVRSLSQRTYCKSCFMQDYPYGMRFPGAGSSDNVVFEGHDCRGHPDLITVIEADPNILVPHDSK